MSIQKNGFLTDGTCRSFDVVQNEVHMVYVHLQVVLRATVLKALNLFIKQA